MARSYTINPDLPTRTYTVTQDGESRTFNAYSGIANVTATNVAAAGAAMKANNLSDLASASTARTNLGLGTAATTDTGTGASNTILGNDARLTDARTPTAHTHVSADVTDATSNGFTANSKILKTDGSGNVRINEMSANTIVGSYPVFGAAYKPVFTVGAQFDGDLVFYDGANTLTLTPSTAGTYTLTLTPTASATLTIGASTTLSGGTHSGTNTGDQTTIVGITGTTAQFNTALTDGDFATLAGSETLTNKTISAPIITNAASFTSATRPTSSGTGTPAATSLVTFADMGAPQIKKSTTQMDVTSSNTLVDITGLTGYSLDADTIYRVEFFGSITAGASGGYKIALTSSTAFYNTTSGAHGLGVYATTAGIVATPFQISSTNIQINARTGASTALPVSTTMYIRTTTASTVALQFAQNVSNGTTSSLLSGAVASITKII